MVSDGPGAALVRAAPDDSILLGDPMVMTLVLLTFVVFIGLDYFVFSRDRAAETATELIRTESAPEPLPTVRQRTPVGIFLQPTFTWSRFGSAGEVYLGVHPMLVGLIGEACEYETRNAGESIAKGEPLMRLRQGDHHLTVLSPIAGKVEHVNRLQTGEARWRDLQENDGGWLYRIQPERAADEVPAWMVGERAAEWTRRQYEQLRAYLHDTLAESHLGVVMADGGDLPVGVLVGMEDQVWTGLQDRFLGHEG